jgi:lipid A ethanolaminephosphotransferase
MQLFRSSKTAAIGASPDLPASAPARLTFPATVEQTLIAVALFWVLSANRMFFTAALQGRTPDDPSAWGFAAGIAVLVFCIHLFLLALMANRWIVKPLLAVLLLVGAVSSDFMQTFGVYLDPTMIRNALRTDVAEASELLSLGLILRVLLWGGVPLLLLWRVRIVNRPWRRAIGMRLGLVVLSLAGMVGSLLLIFQPFSSLMRNHKEIRYLITPANGLWSLGSVLLEDARGAARPRQVLGADAHAGPLLAARSKPMVVVLMVGETARAANWGLSGYARQTTPELAQLPVISFPDVHACGTNTEVSLPCMFAPVGLQKRLRRPAQ